MALTFAQQRQLSDQLAKASKESATEDSEVLQLARSLVSELGPADKDRPTLEQLVAQVGSELYAERGRGTHARHLARGVLLILKKESVAEKRSYDPAALLRFALDELIRADGNTRVLSRLRLTERDRIKAEELFRDFCEEPKHTDEELLAFARRVAQPGLVEPVLSARFHSDVKFVATCLGGETLEAPMRATARGALCYLAENNDAICDDVGAVGFTDDMHILSLAAGEISPLRNTARELIDGILNRWPFLTRLELEHPNGNWVPSATTLLSMAAVSQPGENRVTIVLPRTAGVALNLGILLALGALWEAPESRGSFRPAPGEFISPVGKATPVEVEGYYDENLKRCEQRLAAHVALMYSTGAKKPPVKRYKPLSDLSRYVTSCAPRSRASVDLRDRAAEVELGPLEGLFGRTRPVRKVGLGKRIIIVSPLQASRATLTETLLLGAPLSDSIPCGRIRFDEGTLPEMWSRNAPAETSLLTVVRNTARAAILAEQWSLEDVTVLVPVDQTERCEAELNRMLAAGAKLVVFAPTRSLDVQEFLASSGFRFLDWTSEFTSAVGGTFSSSRDGPLLLAESRSLVTATHKLHQDVLTFPAVDEAFDRLQALRAGVEDEYGDEPEDTLALLVVLLQDVFFRLSASLEENTTLRSLLAVKSGLETIQKSRRRWSEAIQGACSALASALLHLAESLCEANPKAQRIRSLLKHHAGATLLCSTVSIEDTKKAFPLSNPRAFLTEEIPGRLLAAAWLGEKRMLKAFFPPPAQDTHLVLYEWEARCMARPLSRRSRLIREHWSSARVPALPMAGQSAVGSVENPSTQEETASSAPPIDDWLAHAREQRTRSLLSSASLTGERTIATHLVLLGAENFAFYTPTHGVLRLEDITRQEASEEGGLDQVAASELKAGDLIVETTSGSRDLIRETADERLPPGLRNLARMWHGPLTELRSSEGSDQAVYRRLRAAGCKRVAATVRGWIHSEYLIGPHEGEDLDIIAKVTGSTSLAECLDDVFDAIRTVRAEHLSAASRLQKMLTARVSEQLSDGEGLLEGLVVEGNLLVFRVESVYSDLTQVAISQANRVREL